MDEKYSLKDVCKIFEIQASTIRYWDKEGLLHVGRNVENNYREFNFMDLCEVSDMIFYRRMGLTVDELKKLYLMDVEDLLEVLNQSSERTEHKIAELEAIDNQINRKIAMINEMLSLKSAGYKREKIGFSKMIPFYQEGTPHQLVLDLSKFAVVIDNKEGYSMQFGYIVPETFTEGSAIWERKNGSSNYIRFLLELPTKLQIEQYLKPHITAIEQQYNHVERFIARYIVTANNKSDGILYDYYEAWAEIV